MKKNLNLQYLQKIWDNKRVRQRLAFESPFWFAVLYLRHHFSYPFAPFHMEMFYFIEQPKYKLMVIMAFRESGKSTVMNLVNTLWSILGKPSNKFVIIMSQTQEQAKNHFANIKSELESNELLKEDFGPFIENINQWNKLSLELEYHGAKIVSVTRDQKVRGLKYNQHRPDLIICDDLEDSVSIEDEAASEEFVKRFRSEILPLGSENTRIVVLGNLLTHYWDDLKMDKSFILQLKNDIENAKIKGIFRGYPLIDDLGNNLWLSRFPNRKSVLKLRMKFSLEIWIREYLIKSYGQNNEGGPNIKFEDDYAIRRLREEFPMLWKRNSTPKQKALVPQMKDFVIRAPRNTVEVFRSHDDPEYSKFLNDMYFYPKKGDLKK